MMIRLLLMSVLMAPGAGLAMPPISPPGLLSTETSRQLLEQDPGVAAARAGLEVALREAGIFDLSPYEWTTRVTTQQRRLRSGADYNEWSVAVERAIRLPGKAAADRNLGKVAIEESKARYGEALHESARELTALWVEWLAAERAHALTQNSLQSSQASQDAVEKRVRAGDASRLDLSIARAELAEQRRMEVEARTQAQAAWARLSARFPGVSGEAVALPTPLEIEGDAAAWRARILEQNDELKVVRLQVEKALAHAERARADKLPDPTVGGYTASEVGGRERIYGVMLSVPIPGRSRDARQARAIAAVDVARQAAELKQRELEAAIASAVATARGAYAGLQVATEGAASMAENAALMQRAYALGEADLQSMLLARRQATAAAHSALQAQVSALRAYYALLVDAHLIWELDHD